MSDRRALLTAALGFVHFPPATTGLRALHAWLDSWTGVRVIAAAMATKHHALVIDRREAAWTATFTYTGPTPLPRASASGLATGPTPWQTVQWAAWQVVRRDV